MPEASTKHPKILYAMLRRTEDLTKLGELIHEHLQWMQSKEKEGSAFLSGTTEATAAAALNGLTIFQVDTNKDAEALAREDPLTKSGAVSFSLHKWTVNEGRVTITLDLSDWTVSLGRETART